jgi:hypothetical protein
VAAAHPAEVQRLKALFDAINDDALAIEQAANTGQK